MQPFLDNMVRLCLGCGAPARPPRFAHGESEPRGAEPPNRTTSLTHIALLSQVYSKNQSADPNVAPLPKGERPVLPMETVLSLVIDAFTGATERHIEVGDGLQIWTIVKGEGAKLRELREFGIRSVEGGDEGVKADHLCA